MFAQPAAESAGSTAVAEECVAVKIVIFFTVMAAVFAMAILIRLKLCGTGAEAATAKGGESFVRKLIAAARSLFPSYIRLHLLG